MATPLALVISTSNSAKKGILIKDSDIIEIVPEIDTVIFDKTGTLTYGRPLISKIYNHSNKEEKEILELLSSIERYSNHPIARGINDYVKEKKIKSKYDLSVEDLVGYGLKAKDKDNVYYACNSKLLKKLDISNPYEKEELLLSQDGNTIIYLIKNKKIIAILGLKDKIRPEVFKLLEYLKNNNINTIILSGDSEVTTMKIANELCLEKEQVYSGVSPKDKNKIIKELMEKDHKVMMVGDGINDAPALKISNIGVSLNSGTDIASSSANVVLINNNLLRIKDLFFMSKTTKKIIKQNLFWAILYNALMIPIATGLLEKVEINPMLACSTMIISSLSVTINSLRIKQK